MRRLRRLAWWTGGVLAVLAALAAGCLLVVRSAWFGEKVRQRIVREIERATGGATRLDGFRFEWRTLTASLEGLTLRGLEAGGEPPLFHARQVRVGLRVVSAMKRDVDIAFLSLDQPHLRVVIYPDGRTNFPKPKAPARPGPGVVDQILRLAVGQFEVSGGELEFEGRRIPLHFRGQQLRAQLHYDPAGPSYRGEVGFANLVLRDLPQDRFGLDAALAVAADHLDIEKAALTGGSSSLRVSGRLDGWRAPRLELDLRAALAARDVLRLARIPIEPRGGITFAGRAAIAGGHYRLTGELGGEGLAVASGPVRVEGIRLSGELSLDPQQVRLEALKVQALDGLFTGRAGVEAWKRFRVAGAFRDFALQKLTLAYQGLRPVPWNAAAAGDLTLEGALSRTGVSGLRLHLESSLQRAGSQPFVEGLVRFDYNQEAATLAFGESHLATRASRAAFRGTLGRALDVDLSCRDLDDLLPAMALAGRASSEPLPVRLGGGEARFRGRVSGPLGAPRVAGRVTASRAEVDGRRVDQIKADFTLEARGLRVAAVSAARNGMRVQGKGHLGLESYQPSRESPVEAEFTLRDAQAGELLALAGASAPVEGTLSGKLRLGGKAGALSGQAWLDVAKGTIDRQPFDHMGLELRYLDRALEVVAGTARLGKAEVRFQGRYEHAAGDFATGRARLSVKAQALPLAEMGWASRSGLSGTVDVDASLEGALQQKAFRLTAAGGRLAAREVAVGRQRLGELSLTASTAGGQLRLAAGGQFRGGKLSGGGQWNLDGDGQGLGKLEVSGLSLRALISLALPRRDWPFTGNVTAAATFSGPLLHPGNMRSQVRIDTFQMRPGGRRANLPDPALRELVLENSGPVRFALDPKGVTIHQARFVAKGTELSMGGSFAFGSKTPWNLEINGGLNFALLQTLYPEIQSSGAAVVNATVRGTLEDPQVGGRMELRDASLSFPGLSNGIDRANGLVLFSRNRANLEKLTAQTGGGDLELSGFLGFGGPEWIYRLQGKAARVRVRYPEGTSTTLSALLNLTGTSQSSLLAGTITVERAAFTQKTDLASILAKSDKPVTTPTVTNPLLQAVQLDIQVLSSSALEVQTNLTRDVQAEANLRLRGTLAKPILLGRIDVNRGEIQFFGNRYTISRGEIAFYNAARIEPVLAMDLETRVRGITVSLNFSGPLNKLNMSYRSDPPLESGAIVALLAVGRTPGVSTSMAGGPAYSNPNALQSGGALLGQAIASPVSGRLQRFFGVSRLKIDPQLTGLDTTPQARLTLEQQISPDITLTYVTNLTKTQQQLVRLEWNLNRAWSVIAVRDENGVFGMDFQYKKSFR